MSVEVTVERVLRLLELLQCRSAWSAQDLADSLRVTPRTIRRDVDRLRALGYPVNSSAGVGGGYSLGVGGRMPPLLLDDDEAVATTLALRLAASSSVAGAEAAALRALGKLDQVLPPRLRDEVRSLQQATASVATAGTPVDPDVLLALARAVRKHVRTTFTYTTAQATSAMRTVEPVQLVTTGPRWYLMAYDLDRDDWRTFRLDRMNTVRLTTWTFRERDHPEPADYVRESVARAPYSFTARVRLHAPAHEIRARVPVAVGTVDAETDACNIPECSANGEALMSSHHSPDAWSVLTIAADDFEWVAAYVTDLGFEAQVLEPAELRDAAARLAHRVAALAHVSAGAEPNTEHGAEPNTEPGAERGGTA